MWVLTCHTPTMRAALGLLLLCVVAVGAQVELEGPRALDRMCEIEDLLTATFWNHTLAAQGATPEQIDDVHAIRMWITAGHCIYRDRIQAMEDEDKAKRVCIKEREQLLLTGFREATASNNDALIELKKFNARAEALRDKGRDKEAEERLQASIGRLGQATANHEGAWKEFHESREKLNAVLAGYRERLARVAVGLPEFEHPSGEVPSEIKEWQEHYELQSVVNQARAEAARQEMEDAVRRASEVMQTMEANVAELRDAVSSRKPPVAPAGEVNAVAQ